MLVPTIVSEGTFKYETASQGDVALKNGGFPSGKPPFRKTITYGCPAWQ